VSSGNFGVVSVVRNRIDGRQCVLKEIDLTACDEATKRAALGEAQLLSSLQHPCIVGYIESFLTAEASLEAQSRAGQQAPSTTTQSGEKVRDTLVIVMQFCEGGDVGAVIHQKKLLAPQGAAAQQAPPPFPEEQILDWFIQLALALKYIHSKHVLHRGSMMGIS
jgi:NIMA (never in mitosis gene a)-related kinase